MKKENGVVSKAGPSTKIEKRRRDDERRRQSLIDKEKIKRDQQKLIKTALSEASKPKKIVFDVEDDFDDAKPEKKLLFDEDGDMEETIINETFDEGYEKKHKLMKLQSRFNHDERFRVDDRFIDDEIEENKVEDGEPSLLNGQLSMARFVPSDTSPAVPKVKTDKKKKTTSGLTHAAVPFVEQNKYYEVSESIKETLKEEKKGFSLLAAYGGAIEPEKPEVRTVEMAKPFTKRNPLMDISSDEESGREDEDDDGIAPWRPAINVPLSGSTDCFFFIENDPLFKDAIEFINKKHSEEAKQAAEQYSETRQKLKRIFKDQFAKRTKKADMFKKKIGGMKKNPRNMGRKNR